MMSARRRRLGIDEPLAVFAARGRLTDYGIAIISSVRRHEIWPFVLLPGLASPVVLLLSMFPMPAPTPALPATTAAGEVTPRRFRLSKGLRRIRPRRRQRRAFHYRLAATDPRSLA
jgi:hypothetical protein